MGSHDDLASAIDAAEGSGDGRVRERGEAMSEERRGRMSEREMDVMDQPVTVVRKGKDEKYLPHSMDAMLWAEEFVAQFDGHVVGENEKVDVGLMLAWFANAIMAGFDEAQRRNRQADSNESGSGS
jgi:hypothetical protein